MGATATAQVDDRRSQPLEALARANEVRCAAAELRAEVTARRLAIREALWDPRAQSLPIATLLRFQWRWGRKRVNWLLATVDQSDVLARPVPISPTKRVSELSERQKRLIADGCER